MTPDASRYDTDPDALALAHAKAQELQAVPVAVAFGQRARALRLERDWTLEAMAGHSGVGRATVHRIEHGDSNVRLGTAAKVAAAFGLELAEMFAPEAP